MKFGRADYDRHIGDTLNLLQDPIIPMDEPVFLFRATDSLGLAMIGAYINQLDKAATTEDERRACDSARDQLHRMRSHKPSTHHLPDLTSRQCTGGRDRSYSYRQNHPDQYPQ